MMRCPICHSETDRIPPEKLADASGAADMEHRFISLLAKHVGKPVATERIVSHLYADDPNGGPDNPRDSLYARAFRARKKLLPLGYTIRGSAGRGRDGAYRLIPLYSHKPEEVPFQ